MRAPDIKRHGLAVIAGWGALNTALMFVLLGYGGSLFPLVLYGASALLVMVLALTFFALARPYKGYRRPPAGDVAALLAISGVFIGLSAIFGTWLIPVAVGPLLVALVHTRHRRS